MAALPPPPPAPLPPAEPLRFFGGTAGALAPLALFLAGVSWLGLSGAPDERGLWPVLLAALAVGLVLARDKDAYAEAVVSGMSRRLVMIMVLAWLLAGVFGTLLRRSGMVEALVWAAQTAGVSGAGYVVVAFLVAAVFSTATGTSLGTLLVCMPLLYPVGPTLGADPAFLVGAVLGGATFGDNVSPVSDTTIASAGTQQADVGGVVRSRLPYAGVAALGALILFALFGGGGPTDGASGLRPDPALLPAPEVAGWAMLAAPIFVLVMLLRRKGLVHALMYGILAAVLIGLALGAFRPSDLLAIDAENFIATGLILDGMSRSVGIIIFTLLIMGLVGALEATGMVQRVVEQVRSRARDAASAEWWIFGTTSAATLLTTHSVVAILAVGDVARETGRAFGVDRYRRANVMDITVCTWPFLLPFFIPTILAAALTGGGDAPRVSAWTAGLHNFHSWGLLLVLLVAITTGWRRGAQGAGPQGAEAPARG